MEFESSRIIGWVEEVIEEAKLDARVLGIDEDSDPEYPRVRVEVARNDYNRAIGLGYCPDYFSVSWEQRLPELVEAEVGDLVLIYNEWSSDDLESDVGLISSKFTSEDGKVCYGCRYVLISLNNQFISDIYDFELSTEDYGGYPTGFLKVLTPKQAVSHLRKKLRVSLKKAISAAKSKFERTNNNLESLVNSFSQAKRVQCERIELSDNHLPVSVKS